MNNPALADLERLEKAATPGPWSLRGSIPADGLFAIDDGTDLGIVALRIDHEDAALIAAMRNALPELLKIARAVADMSPIEPIVIRGEVEGAQCVLCGVEPGSSFPFKVEHERDCAWVLARKLSGVVNE